MSKLADKNMIVYPMQTCRQSNDLDCGVFMLHFIDEFVGFNGTDKEQYRRLIWKTPLDVEQKRRDIKYTRREQELSVPIHYLHMTDYLI